MIIPTTNAALATSAMSFQNSLAFDNDLSLGFTAGDIAKKISDICLNGSNAEGMEWLKEDKYKNKLSSVVLNSEELKAMEEVANMIIGDMSEENLEIIKMMPIIAVEIAVVVVAVAVGVYVVVV